MSLVLKALQYAVSGAFITLGVLTVRDWLSGRDRRRGYLALALGLLGVTALVGRLQELDQYHTEVLVVLSLATFQGSAYCRDKLRRWRCPTAPATPSTPRSSMRCGSSSPIGLQARGRRPRRGAGAKGLSPV